MQFEMYSYIFIFSLAMVLLVIGWILSVLSESDRNTGNDLEQRIEQALPGVQCAQCGHPGCAAYARALCEGKADINQCVPGGPDTLNTLAEILKKDPSQYAEDDEMIFNPRVVAMIHKSPCTGCMKCKKVCPVDAIMGKIRYIHEVDVEECIGCGDCVAACPETCIEMVSLEPTVKNFNWDIKSIRILGGSNN